MAFYVKKSMLFVLTWLLQAHDLVLTCTESCICNTDHNVDEPCFFNVTLKDATKIVQLPVCCNCDSTNNLSLQQYSNVTLKEISFAKEDVCNTSNFNFNIPFLDTVVFNIENNGIKKIKFSLKFDNLRVINLSSNKLQYITKGMFREYSNLVKLLINRNELQDIFDGSFDGLSKLELLDLSENKLTILPNVFISLKNLQHLNLSRNNIEFIHKNYFNNWLLQHLDVSHNNLKKVAPGALQLLPNLARLLLTDNPHLGITQLDTQLLVGTGRRLQQIDASRTGLYQVPEAFTHSVRFLSLVGNKISAIRCGDLDSYPLLQSLDFSDNKIVSVEDDSLGRLEMLLFLNINKNLLTAVPKTLPDELKYFSISNNLIKNLTKLDFKNMPNLKVLLLQTNQIRFIQNNVFDDLLSLEMLDLSNNPIQTLSPSTFDGPLSLRDLRLCFLNVSVLENDANFPVSSPESIQMLHLQSSPSLARQLLMDSAALAAFSHLQYLDLRMNNLSDIRKDLLFYLAQLKTLRLNGNSINCSAELWLREWMTWNKSLSQNETCYYSTAESKEDDIKYNCTFSETFTINESLPPVNLYSTEMINKLLRYYGYLNNKTERVLVRKHENVTRNESTVQKTNTVSNIGVNNIPNVTLKLNKYKSAIKTNKMKSPLTKLLETANVFDQNRLLNDENVFDNEMSHLDSNAIEVKNTDTTSKKLSSLKKYKTGKRLNTPIDTNKVVYSENLSRNESKISSIDISKIKSNTSVPIVQEGHRNSTETYSMTKTEFSSYQAVSSNYAQYLGTVSVTVLIIASLILWASFRLRYRRRRPPPIGGDDEVDQIEVSNISGGVLW